MAARYARGDDVATSSERTRGELEAAARQKRRHARPWPDLGSRADLNAPSDSADSDRRHLLRER
jgi:hypothetical protein